MAVNVGVALSDAEGLDRGPPGGLGGISETLTCGQGSYSDSNVIPSFCFFRQWPHLHCVAVGRRTS